MRSSEEAKDYYAILGSAEDASQDEIERLYKRLAIRHHPDRGGDPEYMKAINEAYGVLGNEAARRAYDASRNRADEAPISIMPPLSPPSSLLPETLLGRLLGALFILCGGLLFLFLIRIYYIRFMWPIFLLAGKENKLWRGAATEGMVCRGGPPWPPLVAIRDSSNG